MCDASYMAPLSLIGEFQIYNLLSPGSFVAMSAAQASLTFDLVKSTSSAGYLLQSVISGSGNAPSGSRPSHWIVH